MLEFGSVDTIEYSKYPKWSKLLRQWSAVSIKNFDTKLVMNDESYECDAK